MNISDFIKRGNFTLKSGEKSDIYVDFKSIISFPEFHDEIAEKVSSKIKNAELICGLPYGAIPLASIISIKKNIPLIMVRKEQKDYGLKKVIEGNYKEKQKVVLIEDVVTTGSSILKYAELIENENLEVCQIISILSRSTKPIKYKDIEVEAIYNLHSL